MDVLCEKLSFLKIFGVSVLLRYSFPYSLKSWTRSGYPGNCSWVPGS